MTDTKEEVEMPDDENDEAEELRTTSSGGKAIDKPWGHLIVYPDGQQAAIVKRRKEYVLDEDFSLDTASLVGSAFHVLVDGEMLWQGVIVGEPGPNKYLCHINVLEPHAHEVQRVFSLDTIMGVGDEARRLLEGAHGDASAPIVNPNLEWRLYDSEERANQAFTLWESTRREREPT